MRRRPEYYPFNTRRDHDIPPVGACFGASQCDHFHRGHGQHPYNLYPHALPHGNNHSPGCQMCVSPYGYTGRSLHSHGRYTSMGYRDPIHHQVHGQCQCCMLTSLAQNGGPTGSNQSQFSPFDVGHMDLTNNARHDFTPVPPFPGAMGNAIPMTGYAKAAV